ncbi:hypothetical protein [Candidatus Odyssella acanthamoebae]|uniref:Uncharacterized protein n=1 Tax=Candidatus Odyssella acanthamoebae TaxID=91604 RepID=A0A077AWL5_9PROT|nr:hypothetical protein [Candidatus Paracaedibacter acanthamoebae]AIK96856.1 hypothetical protein ID47_09105 [Candidatus Paracaedibacter acanthamoebae]
MKNSLLISLLCVTSLTQVEGAPPVDSGSTAMAPVIRELPTNSLYQRQAKQLAPSSGKQKVTNQQRSAPMVAQHRAAPKQQANQLTQSSDKRERTNQQRSAPMIAQHRVAPKQQVNQLAQSPDKREGTNQQRSAPMIAQHRVAPKQQANQLAQSPDKREGTNQQRSAPMIAQHRVAPKTALQKQPQMGIFLTDAELAKQYTTVFGRKDSKSVEKLTAGIWNNYLTTHKMPANNDPQLKTILLGAFEKEARTFSLLNILSKKDPKFQEAYQLSMLTIKVLDFCLQNDGTKSFPPEQRQAIEQQQKRYQANPVAGDSSIGRLIQVSRAANILEAPLTPTDASLLTKLQAKGKLTSDETKRLKSIEIMIQQAPTKYKGTAIGKLYEIWKMNYPQGQGIVAKTRSAFSSATNKVGGALQKINPFKKKANTVASSQG